MIRKLFIHGGIHKTGSSFIQTSLANHREVLMKNGLFIPIDGRHELMVKGLPTSGNGKKIVDLIRNKKFDDVKIFLQNDFKEAEIAGCEKVLYSSEGFFHLFNEVDLFNRFGKVLADLNVDVDCLLFFRDPVDHMMSTFKHRAKDKLIDFDKWIDNDYETIQLINTFLENIPKLTFKWTLKRYLNDSQYLSNIVYSDWLRVDVPYDKSDQQINPSLALSEIFLIDLFRNSLTRDALRVMVNDLKRIPSSQKPKDSTIDNHLKLKASANVIANKDAFDKLNALMEEKHRLILSAPPHISDELPQIKLTFEQYSVLKKHIPNQAVETNYKADLKLMAKILKRFARRILKRGSGASKKQKH